MSSLLRSSWTSRLLLGLAVLGLAVLPYPSQMAFAAGIALGEMIAVWYWQDKKDAGLE